MSCAACDPAYAACTALTSLAPTADRDSQAANWSRMAGVRSISRLTCSRKATPNSQPRKPSTASVVTMPSASAAFAGTRRWSRNRSAMAWMTIAPSIDPNARISRLPARNSAAVSATMTSRTITRRMKRASSASGARRARGDDGGVTGGMSRACSGRARRQARVPFSAGNAGRVAGLASGRWRQASADTGRSTAVGTAAEQGSRRRAARKAISTSTRAGRKALGGVSR